jgi:hypothetical protein
METVVFKIGDQVTLSHAASPYIGVITPSDIQFIRGYTGTVTDIHEYPESFIDMIGVSFPNLSYVVWVAAAELIKVPQIRRFRNVVIQLDVRLSN